MKIGRNDPCPCGSGKKYKKCCMNKEAVIPMETDTSLETLNAHMQKGYDHIQKDQLKEACDEWWTTWEETLDWLGARQVTNIEELNDLAGENVVQLFFNWVQDFEMALERVGDAGEKRYIQMRVDFPTQFRKRFPDSDPTIMLNMGTAAAEALFYLGQKAEGDAQFEKMANEHPKNPWALIRWGDMYTTWMNKETADHDRAREIYEKALKVAKDPADQQDIQERIKDLQA